MAVRHGYGKVVTDGLVFAYDTGDVINSYKGKPVTNLATAIQSRGGDVVADPTDLPDLPKHIAPEVYCSSKIVESTNSWQSLFQYNTAISVADGERFVVTAWVYVPEGKTNNRFNINCSVGSSNTGLTQSPNHDIPTGRWVKLLGSYTNNTGAAVSITSTRLETYTAAEWTGNITCWAANFMIEKSSTVPSAFRGSPATALGASRSVSGSLLDLTGNNSVNVANVSFDSTANIDLDGTNDYIEVADNSLLDLTTDMSFEFIVNADSSQGNLYPRLIDKSAYLVHITQTSPFTIAQNINTSGGLRQTALGSAFTAGEYTHIVTTYDGRYGQIFVNGELNYTRDFSTELACTTNSTSVKFGGNGDTSRPLAGKLPVSKVYNRVLTAGEVKQNFAMYKKRFNI